MATHPIAQGIAQLGRGKDSMLMHVTPNEVAGLQAVAKSMGGEITINPHTGLPEAGFFNAFGSLLPMFAGAIAAPATGGASLGLTGLSATAAPILAGAATGVMLAGAKGEDPLMGGLTGGLGGYGGGNLAGTFAKMGSAGAPAAATAGDILPTAAQVAENPVAFQQAANINAGLPIAGSEGAQAGVVTQAAAPTFGQSLGNVGEGIKQLGSEGGWDAFKKAGGSGMQLGAPLGMAALAGLQPEPFNPENKDKYDPYKTLNLSGNTGLKLYADGGSIDLPQTSAATGGIGNLYTAKDGTPLQNTPMDGYGYGGSVGYAQGGMLNGPGDGMSDSIPATIEGRQPARLADGEFVIPADVVSHLGNGSTKAGSQRLYGMLDKVRKARTGSTKQGKKINPAKYMP